MKALIVGSGLSAYGACLALLDLEVSDITVLDIGYVQGSTADGKRIMNGITSDGSYFEYGINDRLSPFCLNSKRICSSHAYGGYSTVYSGSILRPQNTDLINWPDESRPPDSAYRRILDSLVITGSNDELEEFSSRDGNGLSEGCDKDSYLGKARIALGSINEGVASGKPFCSKNAFKIWSQQGIIKYRSGVYVDMVRTCEEGRVSARFLEAETFKSDLFDIIFLGAGCINTTIVVNNSLYEPKISRYKLQSCPIVLASYLSLGRISSSREDGHAWPRDKCEFFLEGRSPSSGNMWTHTQLGPLNSYIKQSVLEKCPRVFNPLVRLLLDRLWFSITTLNSTLGRTTFLEASDIGGSNKLDYTIHEEDVLVPGGFRASLMSWVLNNFGRLRLIPLPLSGIAGDIIRGNRLGGWHFGGTIPMQDKIVQGRQCHPDGMVKGLKNVYIIDSAGFPSVPGSSVALLTMANSYYICSKAIR